MTRHELITAARRRLDAANDATCDDDHEHYAQHMSALLDLLIEELVGSAPGAQAGPAKRFNPEQVLEDIAIAIKHRTLSCTQRWKIIYYYTRITCVPIEVDVPDKIVLHEFTNKMLEKGFSVTYWNQLKANVIKLYKELES